MPPSSPLLLLLLLLQGCQADPASLDPPPSLNLLLLTPPGSDHVHSCCSTSGPGSGDGGIREAVQQALRDVNGNCTVLEGYWLNATVHTSLQVQAQTDMYAASLECLQVALASSTWYYV